MYISATHWVIILPGKSLTQQLVLDTDVVVCDAVVECFLLSCPFINCFGVYKIVSKGLHVISVLRVTVAVVVYTDNVNIADNMSRHRNVRSLNYSDEYDGYDDEYGQSVEDEYCISPSDAAQFMYDRNRQSTQISAFFDESDNIAEENETEESIGSVRRSSDTFQKPHLSELEEVRLQSCLDEIRNVIGDTIPENIIIETILKNSFDLNKSLDALLSYEPSASKSDDPKPQRERKDRNRDDDFSDFYPCVQSHLTRNQEHKHFNIHCKTRKPQHNCLNADFLMLNHLAVDSTNLSSNFNMKQSNLPKEFSLTVNERTEKFGSVNNICGTTNTSGNSGMLKINNDSSNDRLKAVNSCPETQLKFQIPRLQKLRKDSDKENIAEGDDSDSDEIAFSSLATLAKQYSLKNVTPSEKKLEILEISQSELSCRAPTVPSLRNCDTTSEMFIDANSRGAVCDELVKCHSESFGTADAPDTASKDIVPHKPHCEQYSKNEDRHLSIDDIDATSESGMAERFSKLSTQNAGESAVPLGFPVLLNLCQSDTKSKVQMLNHVPCLREVKSSDKTSSSSGNQNLSSLSEIVKNHLVHKSSSYCNSPHAVGNYEVMKSESCPQFVIPRLHIAQKRRGISESLSDGSQDVNTSSMDSAMADEDNDTENWVIDLKCALKNTQGESTKDSVVVDYPTQDKRFPIDLTPEDHLFVPNLPCLLDASDALREKYSQSRREPSAFGKVLCRKWRVHHVKSVSKKRQISESISRFTFNTPSPDDVILTYLRLK
ncbi:uncharacterized protein LOC126481304 isoform X2 [Schistocerca serialis cubense]|uniref:uncharacterized protein LOC126481304 isoform X2 n=1 Tax=Schistocerca serialis cubense TaxID=2023355 RepID=UPI00214F4E1D|nr:uncharacterized protein LOC126481304 isoform X2 [Schistocerca serialis cubense]